ncbi:MAG: tyrosine-type recombinase/integrase [Saprospiraceae bacterium]
MSRAIYPEFAQINAQLDAYESTFRELLLELTAQYRTLESIPFTVLKNEFLVRVGKVGNDGTPEGGSEDVRSIPTLAEYIHQLIQKRLDQPHKYKPSSLKVYSSLASNLDRYTKKVSPLMTDVDRLFVEGFQNYLVSQKKGINYINKQWSALKVVFKEAREEGIDVQVNTQHSSLIVPRKPVDNIYLTEAEIQSLVDCKLENVPKLARVRDLFVVGCYTGLRFSDLIQLSDSSIEITPVGKILNVVTQKTNTRVKIPLKPLVYAILKRNVFHFRKISNQKANEYLKLICQRAGIHKPVTYRQYPGGKVLEVTEPKWKLVSFHTARRSFATNAYKAGIPMLNIMKITGHRKPSTFMEYIKFDEEENAQIMASNPLFE